MRFFHPSAATSLAEHRADGRAGRIIAGILWAFAVFALVALVAGPTAARAETPAETPAQLWSKSLPAQSLGITAPGDVDPGTVWKDASSPNSSGQAGSQTKPVAETPAALWAKVTAPADDADQDAAAEGTDVKKTLWNDSAPPSQPSAVATAQAATPSETFWDSLKSACIPLPGRQRPTCGYPGWGPGSCFQPTESTWYTRVDYFHWTERIHGYNLLDNQGPLYNLGYTRMGGDMRFRAEFFGGNVAYHGATFGGSGPSLLLNDRTAYYGGRAEYDLFFRSQKHPRILMFIGLGLRAWNRDISSVTLPGNIFVQGYNETWLTLYPYIGFETPHDYTRLYEFYGRSRVGVTAFTYNYAGSPLDTGVYPRPGCTALLEEGFRYKDSTVSGWAEVFGWARSGAQNGLLQPQSTMLTIGIKLGYSY